MVNEREVMAANLLLVPSYLDITLLTLRSVPLYLKICLSWIHPPDYEMLVEEFRASVLEPCDL